MASVSGVQQLQVGCSGGVGTDMVENADKDGISLPVYFLESMDTRSIWLNTLAEKKYGVG